MRKLLGIQITTWLGQWYRHIIEVETPNSDVLVSKEWDRWAVIVMLVLALSVTASLLAAIWGGWGG